MAPPAERVDGPLPVGPWRHHDRDAHRRPHVARRESPEAARDAGGLRIHGQGRAEERDFYQAALTYGIHNPQRAVLGVALTCNLIFAAELYLKALIYRGGRRPPHGHNLEMLFQEIKTKERDEVIASCLPHFRRGTVEEFKLSLHEIGNAFDVLRYSYERVRYVLDYQFFLSLAEALHDLANR